MIPTERGELRYAKTVDRSERRKIQAEVVGSNRERLAHHVRKFVRVALWEEAEQVGAIGVLVALEKFDPARGTPFWAFALPHVRNEIQRWMDCAVYWRPRVRKLRPNDDPRLAKAQRRQDSMDAPRAADVDATLHDICASLDLNAEELVTEKELHRKLGEFVATLSDAEQRMLLRESRNRFCSTSDGRYLSLVERATAFVKGADKCLETSSSK